MSDENISVIDASERLDAKKQRVFKVLKRLGIETFKERHPGHRNQPIAYITAIDFERLKDHLTAKPNAISSTTSVEPPSEFGVFYLIQLEPNHDANRFKVGFTSSPDQRLRHLRCSAPYLKLLETWPCRTLWERTAIDCVTVGCERLHTEVFRSVSLDDVKTRCQEFFALMPQGGQS